MKIFLYSLCFVIFTSCISITGLTNDYGKLTAKQKEMVVPIENFSKTDTLHIYKVNAAQLKSEIAKHPKSLVYVFKNGCTAKYCLPMSVYQDFSEQNNYKLFLVMNGYGSLNETLKQRSEIFTAPLFAIDNDFYKSNIRNTYINRFENDLQGYNLKEKSDYEGNLFFFENGKLVKNSRELPN